VPALNPAVGGSDTEGDEAKSFWEMFLSALNLLFPTPVGGKPSWQDIHAFGDSQSTPSILKSFLTDFFVA